MKAFNYYYEMWNKYGVKLSSEMELKKEILDKVSSQADLCDIIWAINASRQKNKTPLILSTSVMELIQKHVVLIRSHRCFKREDSSDPVDRARRHFIGDSEERFKKRQPKIQRALE